MRNLPNLNSLKAFEAAGRHGTFVAAAAELNVTPAAVSRMVRLLENRLKVRLFARGANKLTLTSEGRAYHQGLIPLFDALASLTQQVTEKRGGNILTIGVGPTFATRWLIPRLTAFGAAAPGVEVRITTGGVAAPFSDDWTCGIKLGSGNWPGLAADELFEAELLPICSPRMARKVKSERDLAELPLLSVTHASTDWQTWFKAAGYRRTTTRGPTFDFYGQAQQAAADGLGIALGLRPYIDDDLAAGRLVAPFKVAARKETRWYLIYKRGRLNESPFRVFRAWLREAVKATE